MAHTLKLRGSELALPGLALPESFENLDKRMDSTIKLCKLNSPHDSQVLSVITICQEMQRLLKCAFIENGYLASRLEIFTQYHTDSLKRMNKTVSACDVEQKVTKKQVKRLRKKLCVYDTYQRRKNEKWWDVEVRSTDYETFNTLSRSVGSPDLEFMLRINQILIDFVRDEERTELLLPPMGHEERAELSKLASIYKIRCRYGKSTQVASSTLMKARQTCIPGHGEVDTILDGFARAQNLKRLTVSSEDVVDDTKHEVVVSATEEIFSSGKGKSKSPPISTIPSTMLTPLSSLSSPTIDISGIASASMTPSQSPPTSGLNTPTPDHMARGRRDSSDKERGSSKNRSRCGSLSSTGENPLPSAMSAAQRGKVGQSARTSPCKSPRPSTSASSTAPLAGAGGVVPLSEGPSTATAGPLTSLHKQIPATASLANQKQPLPPPPTSASPSLSSQFPQQQQPPPPPSPKGAQPATVAGTHHHHHHQPHPLPVPPTTSGGGGGVLMQHHHASLRTLGHPTVVASPLKVPVSQLPHVFKHGLSSAVGVATGNVPKGGEHHEVGGAEGGGEGSAGGGEGTVQPPKRIRLTRKTAGLGGAED